MPKFEINNKRVEAFQLTHDVAAGKSPVPEWVVDNIAIGWLGFSPFFFLKNKGTIGHGNDWIVKDSDGDLYIEKNEIFNRDYTEIIEYVLTKKEE